MSSVTEADRFQGCLLGLAVGDAVGTTLEFQRPGTFEPIEDMVGGGRFRLQPGQWTDDTSMALCLASSLLESNGFEPRDQMERYGRWWRDGYLSSTGHCFDIGNTVRQALTAYQSNGDPFSGSRDPGRAGNGSIMRLAPVVMYYHPDRQAIRHYAVESSKTTHGSEECLAGCRLLGDVLANALSGSTKDELVLDDGSGFDQTPAIAEIARREYLSKLPPDIRGTGYVVESLEAALWCFENTERFESAILLAANLGDDADTTAAVCGQVAGAFYGASAIPARWLERLARGDFIRGLATQLHRAGMS